jgi:hypothetical protein
MALVLHLEVKGGCEREWEWGENGNGARMGGEEGSGGWKDGERRWGRSGNVSGRRTGTRGHRGVGE